MGRIPRRNLAPSGMYHVTARGVDGCPIARDRDDGRFILWLLGDAEARGLWVCDTFCVMPNHFHLLVETELERLAKGIHRLSGIHAQRFNRRHGRTGHLFGDRYAARVVESDRHLEGARAYVLANPVRAGLCRSPEEWPWSGSRAGRSTRRQNTCSTRDPPIH